MAVDYQLTMRHRGGTLTEVLYSASVYLTCATLEGWVDLRGADQR